MSLQKRAITGLEFEKYLCETYGFTPYSKKPKLKWAGLGRSNFLKLFNSDFNPDKFYPILEESKLVKCDFKNGYDLYEGKKYLKNNLNKWLLYSEPIIKIAPSRSKFKKGDFVYDNISEDRYNNFLINFMKSKWWLENNQIVLDKITNSNKGIYCKDGFIPNEDLDFKWVLNSGEYAPIFNGYKRLSIVFKLK